jgi:hypothetical protein
MEPKVNIYFPSYCVAFILSKIEKDKTSMELAIDLIDKWMDGDPIFDNFGFKIENIEILDGSSMEDDASDDKEVTIFKNVWVLLAIVVGKFFAMSKTILILQSM